VNRHNANISYLTRFGVIVGVILLGLVDLSGRAAAEDTKGDRHYYLDADFDHIDHTYDWSLTPWFVIDTTAGSARPDTVYRFKTSSVPTGTHGGTAFWSFDTSHVYLVDMTAYSGLQVDTLLRCGHSLSDLATKGGHFDLSKTNRLLAWDETGLSAARVVVVRYDPGGCHLDTLAVMENCTFPNLATDGSALLATQWQSGPDNDATTHPDFLIYDIDRDTVYNPLPPGRVRIFPRGESIDGPIYYESYADSVGSIWRYRKGEGEDMVFATEPGEKLDEFVDEGDTLIVRVLRRNESGWESEMIGIDLRNLSRLWSSVDSVPGRPPWESEPGYRLVSD